MFKPPGAHRGNAPRIFLFYLIFPSPALSGSGSMGMISACMTQAPLCEKSVTNVRKNIGSRNTKRERGPGKHESITRAIPI